MREMRFLALENRLRRALRAEEIERLIQDGQVGPARVPQQNGPAIRRCRLSLTPKKKAEFDFGQDQLNGNGGGGS